MCAARRGPAAALPDGEDVQPEHIKEEGSGKTATRSDHQWGSYQYSSNVNGPGPSLHTDDYETTSYVTVNISEGVLSLRQVEKIYLETPTKKPWYNAVKADPLNLGKPDFEGSKRASIRTQMREGYRELAALGVDLKQSYKRVGMLSAASGLRPESVGVDLMSLLKGIRDVARFQMVRHAEISALRGMEDEQPGWRREAAEQEDKLFADALKEREANKGFWERVWNAFTGYFDRMFHFFGNIKRNWKNDWSMTLAQAGAYALDIGLLVYATPLGGVLGRVANATRLTQGVSAIGRVTGISRVVRAVNALPGSHLLVLGGVMGGRDMLHQAGRQGWGKVDWGRVAASTASGVVTAGVAGKLMTGYDVGAVAAFTTGGLLGGLTSGVIHQASEALQGRGFDPLLVHIEMLGGMIGGFVGGLAVSRASGLFSQGTWSGDVLGSSISGMVEGGIAGYMRGVYMAAKGGKSWEEAWTEGSQMAAEGLVEGGIAGMAMGRLFHRAVRGGDGANPRVIVKVDAGGGSPRARAAADTTPAAPKEGAQGVNPKVQTWASKARQLLESNPITRALFYNRVVKSLVKVGVHNPLTKWLGIHDGLAQKAHELGYEACFATDTPLMLTEWLSKPIQDFKSYEEYGDACDWILTRDENDPNGPLVRKRVLRKFVRTSPVMEVWLEGRCIETTWEHPFHVIARVIQQPEDEYLLGWLPAGWLRKGDVLLSHDGKQVTVEKVVDTQRVTTVYNLLIEDCHTYFVGTPEWQFSVWAHNGCKSTDVNDALTRENAVDPRTAGL